MAVWSGRCDICGENGCSHDVVQSCHDRGAQITEALRRRVVTGEHAARNAANQLRFAGTDKDAAVLFAWRRPVLGKRGDYSEGPPFSSPAICVFLRVYTKLKKWDILKRIGYVLRTSEWNFFNNYGKMEEVLWVMFFLPVGKK